MKAFHNDKAIKNAYLIRVKLHIKADNLIRGEGWNGTKGCAIGCTLEKYNHKAYETELGIPEWLARVEDTLFEGMSEKKSRTWPYKFLEAITVGADLETVHAQFIVAVLKHTLKSISKAKFDADKFPDVAAAITGSKAAVRQMIQAQESGNKKGISAASWAAESAAESAASAAAYAAAAYAASSAARAAAEYESAWAARSAAYAAAAWAASSAARAAAESAAESVAWAASSAARVASWAAYSAARAAAYDHYANELLKLLRKTRKSGK